MFWEKGGEYYVPKLWWERVAYFWEIVPNFFININKLVVINDYASAFDAVALIQKPWKISLAVFEPLSVAKINIFLISNRGCTERYFSDKVHAILIEEVPVQTTLRDGASSIDSQVYYKE